MLVDRFGRTIDYVRISVTDRCDLRCTYCIPKGFKDFEVHENWLSFDEIYRIVSAFARLGVRKFRITGGEPLLRKDIHTLIERISKIENVEDISMTTNGTQLVKYAKVLKKAGLNRLNISLDGFSSQIVKNITGLDCFDKVVDGILLASEQDFDQIKINMVPMPNINEDQIDPVITFCIEHGLILRLIEVMPMGNSGQTAKGKDLSEFLTMISKRYDLLPTTEIRGAGPARYWTSKDKKFTLGLITPISQHFCETCNRIRLSVEGTLYMCLGQEDKYPLRELLRSGCDDDQLESALKEAIDLKPERHEFTTDHSKINRIMSMTGG